MHSNCIIVMGPYRSGTSLVSQILNALGVDFGPQSVMIPPPNRQNPGGYFQRPDVVGTNVALIEAAGGTEGLPHTPLVTASSATPAMFSPLAIDWSGGGRWLGVKDPRFSITLYAWIQAQILDVASTRIINVARNPSGIVRSVLAHDAVRQHCGEDEDAALEMTRRYLGGASWHARHLGIPALAVSYDTLLVDTERTVRQMANFVEMDDATLTARAVGLVGRRGAVLRHYGKKLQNPSQLLHSTQQTVAAVVRRFKGRQRT